MGGAGKQLNAKKKKEEKAAASKKDEVRLFIETITTPGSPDKLKHVTVADEEFGEFPVIRCETI